MNGAEARRRRTGRSAASLLLLLALMAASVVPRLPYLVNADYAFSSDEAVNALVIKHLVERGEWTAFNWDATYYGIIEGLLALPFAALLGFTPLAFKLAALAGHLALMGAVFLLGRRLYGEGAGLAAAALLVAFSPQLVQWSTSAAVGYCLIVAWGTLTLLHLDRLLAAPTRAGIFLLGLLVGFGLYLYELYLVYAALLAMGGILLLAGRLLRRPRGQAPPAPRPAVPLPAAAALLAAGFALGWAPKLWLLAGGGGGSKAPSYGIVSSLALLRANLRLLAEACAPALLGVNPLGSAELLPVVGPVGPAARAAGGAALALWTAAWLWAAARTARRWFVGQRAGAEGLLVLLVPLNAALFALSPNAQGILNNRFLLPWAGSLPVLAGGALAAAARCGGMVRVAAWAPGLLLAVYPAAQVVAWHLHISYLAPGPRLVRRAEPLREVIRALDRRGIRGAYGGYWTAYKATLLSGERVVIAPIDGWDRYPPYTRRVDRLDRVAYVYRTDFEQMEPMQSAVMRQQLMDFLNRLESASRRYEVARIPPYELYLGPGGRRLLAPALDAAPTPLATPRAEVAAGPVPAAAPAGALLRVPVRLTNRSDGVWSATGLPLLASTARVAVSYRWYDPAGAMVVDNGERSLLPRDLRPGESLAMVARVRAPEAPGPYDLSLTLVQENVAWFDLATGSASPRLRVQVGPHVPVAAAPLPSQPGP